MKSISRSNSSNKKISYKLNEEEKLLLGYEFSKEKIFYTLVEYKTAFNEIYRAFINIFRRFFIKKSRNNLKAELAQSIKELGEKEQELLLKYKMILHYLALSKTNINNTDIYLEFANNEEKDAFFKSLKDRKELLKRYMDHIRELEYIRNRINSAYDKVITNSCVDIQNK